jgi:CRP-like cAMP-binding protein
MSISPSSPNRLLASLLPADFELLRPHLRPTQLKNETVLYEAGDPVDRVFFPHSGIISLVVELSEGQLIEAAMIGRDSMLGATAAQDGQVSLNKAIVQLSGTGETLDVGQFERWPARVRRCAQHCFAMSRWCLRRPSNPQRAMPLTPWKPGWHVGCYAHAISPATIPSP